MKLQIQSLLPLPLRNLNRLGVWNGGGKAEWEWGRDSSPCPDRAVPAGPESDPSVGPGPVTRSGAHVQLQRERRTYRERPLQTFLGAALSTSSCVPTSHCTRGPRGPEKTGRACDWCRGEGGLAKGVTVTGRWQELYLCTVARQ